MNSRPLFSILHTSARPDKWRAVYEDWMSKAVHPEDVEYVLCVDERWGFEEFGDDANAVPAFGGAMFEEKNWGTFREVVNRGRRCYVDGVNTAAKASTGRILIVNADDQFACEGWDDQLGKSLRKGWGWPHWGETVVSPDLVISVSTGTPQEHERGIMVMPILSRARYERLGYVFYPQYESMYADNDFGESARHDGVVIEARHLIFEHRHGLWNKGRVPWDAAYQAQNRPEAYAVGESLLKRRRAVSFNGIAPETPSGPPVIAVCLPGETFSVQWVCAWTLLFCHLVQRGFHVVPCFNHTSNVYFTRQALAEMAMQSDPKATHVLWIDDDQILTPENFDRLYELMCGISADMIAGWTWIQDDAATVSMVSAGTYSADDAMVTFVPRHEIERVAALKQAFEVEWTGFPAVLMRAEVIAKASENARQRNRIANPFAPLPAPNSKWGFTGEDISFCVNAKDAGCRIFVDAGCYVPHLKLRAVVPTPIDKRVESEREMDRVISQVRRVPDCGCPCHKEPGDWPPCRACSEKHQGALAPYRAECVGV